MDATIEHIHNETNKIEMAIGNEYVVRNNRLINEMKRKKKNTTKWIVIFQMNLISNCGNGSRNEHAHTANRRLKALTHASICIHK